MNRPLLSRAAAAALLITCAAPAAGVAQDSLPPRADGTAPAAADSIAWARISYLTATTAYLDAGRSEGLTDSTVAEVVRSGGVIARIRVAFLSSHRASGELEQVAGEPQVGDSVRFVPRAASTVVAAGGAEPTGGPAGAGSATRSRSTTGRLHGRLGVRYLHVRDRSGLDTRFSQPSLDVRVDGTGLGGTPLGVAVDVRARRTTSTRSDGSSDADGRYRVYRMAVFWSAPGSPARVTLGRQYSAPLSPVSFFDGVTAEYLGSGWRAGVFGGMQPDPVSFGVSSTVREAGGYVQLHAAPASRSRWTLTGGAVGSYTEAGTDREFAFLQGSYSDRRVSLYALQEVDYYRAWKRAAGEPTLSATSSFATALVRLGGGLSARAGFDSRRNVRLVRDFETPETEFDDAYRQGWWGGLSLSTGRVRLGADLRTSRGGSAGPADSWTLSAGATRLTAALLDLRLRTTRYTTERGDGWLHAATVGADPLPRLHLSATGGLRQRHDPLDDPADSDTRWLALDLDLTLGRTWYAILSATRESGAEASDQIYGGISWRF